MIGALVLLATLATSPVGTHKIECNARPEIGQKARSFLVQYDNFIYENGVITVFNTNGSIRYSAKARCKVVEFINKGK